MEVWGPWSVGKPTELASRPRDDAPAWGVCAAAARGFTAVVGTSLDHTLDSFGGTCVDVCEAVGVARRDRIRHTVPVKSSMHPDSSCLHTIFVPRWQVAVRLRWAPTVHVHCSWVDEDAALQTAMARPRKPAAVANGARVEVSESARSRWTGAPEATRGSARPPGPRCTCTGHDAWLASVS